MSAKRRNKILTLLTQFNLHPCSRVTDYFQFSPVFKFLIYGNIFPRQPPFPFLQAILCMIHKRYNYNPLIHILSFWWYIPYIHHHYHIPNGIYPYFHPLGKFGIQKHSFFILVTEVYSRNTKDEQGVSPYNSILEIGRHYFRQRKPTIPIFFHFNIYSKI